MAPDISYRETEAMWPWQEIVESAEGAQAPTLCLPPVDRLRNLVLAGPKNARPRADRGISPGYPMSGPRGPGRHRSAVEGETRETIMYVVSNRLPCLGVARATTTR